MNRATLASWQFRLHQAGWPLWLALVLTGVALALGPWVADHLRAEAQAIDVRLAQQRHDAERRSVTPDQLQAETGAALVARLPDADAALAAVQDLHRLAQQHGVVLASGDYRLVRDGGAGWQRYQINLPAQGDDLALRRWMADALNQWPSLSLDDWAFTREQATQREVQARVRWSFYLKASS